MTGQDVGAALDEVVACLCDTCKTAQQEQGPWHFCECPPCPGRGNDGHGMSHCAECCFGSMVEADEFCPIHGRAALRGGTA